SLCLAPGTALGAGLAPWAVLALPAAAAGAVAVSAPLSAFSITQETDERFPLVMRFLTLPMFLFSATFFPLSQLPSWLQPLAVLSPLWHSVELCRSATTGQWGPGGAWGAVGHVVALAVFVVLGWVWGTRSSTGRLAPGRGSPGRPGRPSSRHGRGGRACCPARR